MKIQTIFESDNYLVRTFIGDINANCIVVSFTGISAPERHDGTFFGATLALKLNIPWVGIIDRHDNWYCNGMPEEAFSVALAWIAARQKDIPFGNKSKLIGFGISMGAYAVLKYSRRLGFDYVLAAAPQWSLDVTEASYHSHFKHLYRPFMKGMGVRSHNVQGKIYVFYDPYEEPDRKEVQMLKRHTNVNEIAVFNGGHMVLSSIKGSHVFREILNHLEDPVAIQRISTSARRYNFENITRMIECAFNRDPRLALQAFRTKRFATVMKRSSGENLDRIWEIATKLARIGYACEADDFFACATGSYPTCIVLPRLMSWRGELLCYCHNSSSFSQTRRHLPERGSMVTLVNDMLFAATPVGLVPVPGQLIFIGQGRYAIVIDNFYLSARYDEHVELVPHLNDWEEFSFLPARS